MKTIFFFSLLFLASGASGCRGQADAPYPGLHVSLYSVRALSISSMMETQQPEAKKAGFSTAPPGNGESGKVSTQQ